MTRFNPSLLSVLSRFNIRIDNLKDESMKKVTSWFAKEGMEEGLIVCVVGEGLIIYSGYGL
ncbi:unnamed protein product, partial [Dovyalis caffra]